VFHTHLIILDEQVIDVILGMSWMKLHKAILNIAKRLVCLDSLVYGKVTLHIPAIVCLKASVHHIVAKSVGGNTHGTRISGCFSRVSIGMPPETDIKFKIELQPSTTAVTKSPY
jgi:hypothetical protein